MLDRVTAVMDINMAWEEGWRQRLATVDPEKDAMERPD